jgi:hypothetical protein
MNIRHERMMSSRGVLEAPVLRIPTSHSFDAGVVVSAGEVDLAEDGQFDLSGVTGGSSDRVCGLACANLQIRGPRAARSAKPPWQLA